YLAISASQTLTPAPVQIGSDTPPASVATGVEEPKAAGPAKASADVDSGAVSQTQPATPKSDPSFTQRVKDFFTNLFTWQPRGAAGPPRVTSAEEISAERLPHHPGQLQALGVDALVVAVEHHRVLGVRDAQRVQAEAVRGDALPAEELRVGAARRDRGHDG